MRIKLFLYIITFLVALNSCSSQKRLARLIKNNPELKHIDTVYSTRSFTIAGYKLDTTFEASKNVNGLDELVNVYREYMDSIKRTKLISEIKTFIVERKCLDDTFKIYLNNNGWCKLWQTKGLFHYQLSQPKQKLYFTVPVSINSVKANITNDWKMFFIGICSAFSIVLLLIFLKPVR